MNRCRNTRECLICLWVGAAVVLIAGGDTKADFAFGTPINLGPAVNSSSWDNDPSLSADGLSLFFDSGRPGGHGGFDIYVATRETVQDSWGQAVNIGPWINSADDEATPSLSTDGLVLYFVSNRPGGSGSYDIWVTTRETIQDSWGDPVNVGSTINSATGDFAPRISADGLSLFFNSSRPGGYGSGDLWVSTRPTLSDPWGEPVNLGSTVNSSSLDYSPAPSPDGLVLFFSSNRPGAYGDWNIWVTRRTTRDDDWGTPVGLGPAVNSSPDQENPYISADGSALYFGSTRAGGSGNSDLWQVSINPVVDFNGDGKANGRDVVIMVGCWGENEPACDIGPTPLGDGIVDEQDLFVLAEYLEGEDLVDPTLIAHWAFEETEGMAAVDSAGGNDATVMGNAAWQPEAGKVGGALEFDGISVFVLVRTVPVSGEGPFSILAWIKGGAPGQVVLSQQGAADWLYADPLDGSLMTGLGQSGRNATPLLSDTAVTDGQWHRIGLVWDGKSRILYADEQEVARDTQSGLNIASTGLLIGSGGKMIPNTFFSGLIDDVRIYNRVVKP